jgi:hypothetical protein
MPSNPRPGLKGLYVEFPEGLLALLGRRALEDRRTLKMTLVLAAEAYLGVGPADYQAGADGPAPRPKGPRKKGGK